MKLELKHIAPYLPYGIYYQLKGNYPIKEGVEHIVENIAKVTTQNFMTVLYDANRKPILRPLTDLVKEINIDGNILNPLVILCKDFGSRIPYNISFGDETLMHADNDGGSKWWFYYNKEKKCFELTEDDKEMRSNNLPQYDMMAKLFEWHFDVFELIKIGLAINVNSLTSSENIT